MANETDRNQKTHPTTATPDEQRSHKGEQPAGATVAHRGGGSGLETGVDTGAIQPGKTGGAHAL